MTAPRVTVGFIPLLDSACLVAAAERGFAHEEGLDLKLVRETSWANIRDRTIVGHFDAAHMLGPITVASTLGVGHVRVPMIAPCALGFGGNAITVSNALWAEMVDAGALPGGKPAAQGAALRSVVAAKQRKGSALTFGMVYPFSCHNYELRYWLAAVGIDPDRDVRLVVIPPPFLVDAMGAGQVDGFCVGEPWSSVAVQAGVGAIATVGTAIWPRSAEKVLGCRREWAEGHSEELTALIRAVYKAAHWCDQPKHHLELAHILAESRFVGAPAELLHHALTSRLALMPHAQPAVLEGFFATAREHATFPFTSHPLWFYSQMVRWGQLPFAQEHIPAVRAAYRPDLYRHALASLEVEMPSSDTRVEAFFDGETFRVEDLAQYLKHQQR